MMLNGPNNSPYAPEGLGDCTIAGCAHAIQVWTLNASKELTLPDSTIKGAYEAWCGYKAGQPSTDNGGVELYVLNDWRKTGLAKQKLLGYADPKVSNLTEIKISIALFGGVYIGLNVPQSVMDNAGDPSIPWDVGGNTTYVGGHCVFVPKYDGTYLYPISWGQVYRMTVPFWNKNVDEAHTLLSSDWIASTGLAPSQVNLQQLNADLAAIR
jgi:hypothetical protein